MNKWGIRLTQGFCFREAIRCIKNPVYIIDKDAHHVYCWGRVLFWYIDFDREKAKKYI